MSKENVQKIIGRLVTDGEFAKSFFEKPDEALKEYELTEEETAGLKAMKKEEVGKFAGSLDERISKRSGSAGTGSIITKP